MFDQKNTFSGTFLKSSHWYRRDRKNHEWIVDGAWWFIFYDLGFDVIEIDYDETNEKIVNRRRPKGRWSATDQHLFEFENEG